MNRLLAFRPDIGAGAGLGHLRRCLSLAIALRKQGFDSVFEVDEDGGMIATAGFAAGEAKGACAYVVDSYRATVGDLARLGRDGVKVIVIDDLADRPLAVDLVINPGIGAETLEYPGARNTGLGIEYALLRPEFADEPNRIHPPIGRRLLITMGGSDPRDLTAQLVSALAKRGFEAMDVIVGPFFGNIDTLVDTARRWPAVMLLNNPSDIRGLMLRADLALTAGGQTIYEIAATATPAAAVEIAPNQRRNLEGFLRCGAIVSVGSAEEPGIVKRAEDALVVLAADRERRATLGRSGRHLVDGRGADRAATRIVEQIGDV